VLYGPRWADMIAPLLPLFLLQAVREICRPGAALTLATGHNRLYALCGILALPLTVVAVLIGSRHGITGVAWAVLIAVGGSSLVWPSIAIAVLRPSIADLWRTVRIPLALAAVSTPAVIGTRAALEATPTPEAIRLLVAILAGAGAFGIALYLCRDSVRADLARMKETLPEDEGAVEEQPAPVPMVPSAAATAPPVALPAADG
jgi:O-antigen/teichoic acid export membrane protein